MDGLGAGAVNAAARASLYENAAQIGGGFIGGLAGLGVAGAGAAAGGAGFAASAAMKRMDLGFGRGSLRGPNLFPKLSYGGAIAGAAGVGLGIAGARAMVSGMKSYSTSPYINTSGNTADRLNASGDIVLGAHNSRRGY